MMKFNIGDKIKIKHGDGTYVEVTIIKVIPYKGYELKAGTPFPMFLSEDTILKLL